MLLYVVKFWPSHAPGKGVCGGAKFFGSALLQPARSVCVSLSVFFFISSAANISYRTRFVLLKTRPIKHAVYKIFNRKCDFMFIVKYMYVYICALVVGLYVF